MSAAGLIVVIAPIHILSEANCRDHWAPKARRVAAHRDLAAWALHPHQPPPPPCTITLTRIGARKLDKGDNLPSGFKATRDGVSDWLGIDDGDDRLTWRYDQRRGRPKEYAAEIKVEFEVAA